MTQSRFTTEEYEALFGEAATYETDRPWSKPIPESANLNRAANLTADEYQILFGDSPVKPVADTEAKPRSKPKAKPSSESRSTTRSATRTVTQPQADVVFDPLASIRSIAGNHKVRADLHLAGLASHPILSGCVLFFSVLVGIVIARGLIG